MISANPFPAAAPDFSDPIGLLRACHERIFQHCATVERLALHLNEKGCDAEFLAAAARIHRYFSTAAQHHHADEEQDLFPILVASSPKMAGLVQRLKQEHSKLDALWQALAPLLTQPDTISDLAAFAELSRNFADAYRAHATRENEELLDNARLILSSDEIRQLGHNMAQRRGATPPPVLQNG